MTTQIVVVDGADGLTPDMLRKRPRQRETFGHYAKIYNWSGNKKEKNNE